MKAITFTEARSKFANLLDKVCKDHSPMVITRQKNQPVALISL